MTDSRDQSTEAPGRRAARDGSAPGGIPAVFARHPRAWLFSALGAVFLLLATGALFAGLAAGSERAAVLPSAPESAPPPRPQPSSVPAGTHLRTCSIAEAAAQPALGALSASILNASTGEVLFDRGGSTPATPANVNQLLTAAAAIKILGADTRLTTRVMMGSSDDTIVLVGGGDPTLATTSATVYEGAPLINDLADSAMAAYDSQHPGKKPKNIVLDASLWNADDNWDDSWPSSLRSNGYLAYVTPLMVDGDRSDAGSFESPRGDDPVRRAGEAFADAAGLPAVTFSSGTDVGSTILAEVTSQPVGTLVGQMLRNGDDTLAEALARLSSTTAGLDGSSASVGQVVPAALKDLGLDTAGLVIKDGSGESAGNSVPPLLVTRLLAKIAANEAGLGTISEDMAVAGESGDLYDRFSGANEAARGKVVGASGWITGARSLAGIISAADGTTLVFAFYGSGDAVSTDTKDALDTLATAAYNCGDNLSNN